MNIGRATLVTLALAVSIILNVSVLLYVYLQRAAGYGKLAQADICDGDSVPTAAKQNPNKAFFISCGGFIE
jgi:hypothetical protein